MERLELSWVSPPPPQDGVSASSTTSAIQELNWRHNLEWIRGFELRYHIDNTQLIDSTFGLTAQMPHNPASIVRLLYGEHAQRNENALVITHCRADTRSWPAPYPPMQAPQSD